MTRLPTSSSRSANGIILGSMYALIAIGFSLIYGIVRLINFAHGDIVTIGAFATLACVASRFMRPFRWPSSSC